MAYQKIYYRTDYPYTVQYIDSATTTAALNTTTPTQLFGWHEASKYASFIASEDYTLPPSGGGSPYLTQFFAGSQSFTANTVSRTIVAQGSIPILGSSYHYGIWYLTSASIGTTGAILDSANQGFIVGMTRYDSNYAAGLASSHYGETGPASSAPLTKGMFGVWRPASGGDSKFIGYSLYIASGSTPGLTLNTSGYYDLFMAGSGEYKWTGSDISTVASSEFRGMPVLSFPAGAPQNVGETVRLRISDLRTTAYYALELWVVAMEVNAQSQAMQAYDASLIDLDHCWVKKVSRGATGDVPWGSGYESEQPYICGSASDGNWVDLNVNFPVVGTWDVRVLETSKNMISKSFRVESVKKIPISHFLVYARASTGGGIPSGTGNEPGFVHDLYPTTS